MLSGNAGNQPPINSRPTAVRSGHVAGGPKSNNAEQLPDLYVDLDGTLLRGDISVESFVRFVGAKPANFILLLIWLVRGRAFAKAMVARCTKLDVRLMSYREPLVDHLDEQRRSGRRVFLATASHRRYATQVARHLGLFDGVLATTAKGNLKAARKAEAIRKHTRGRPFAYAGDSRADWPVWQSADRALVVAQPSIAKKLQSAGKLELSIVDGGSWTGALWRALRPHQWVKNTLLFIPLLTSHRYDALGSVAMALIGFALFCAVASATYLLNDIIDIEADRAHPRKRTRPFASGQLSIMAGAGAGLCLFGAASATTFAVMPPLFTLLLLTYAVTTTSYSLWLKRVATVDAIVLAGLYTLRILAGAAAVGVGASFWLLAFSMFIFSSLAYLKRFTEVSGFSETGEKAVKGRGYYSVDTDGLFTLGGVTGVMSVLVLALYIDDPAVQAKYAAPVLLWGICPFALMWVSRIWLAAKRGEVHDDPVVHALRDVRGLALVAACVVFVLAAQSEWIARVIVENLIWR